MIGICCFGAGCVFSGKSGTLAKTNAMSKHRPFLLIKSFLVISLLLQCSVAFGQFDSLQAKGSRIDLSASVGLPPKLNPAVKQLLLDHFPNTKYSNLAMNFHFEFLITKNWRESTLVYIEDHYFDSDTVYINLNRTVICMGLTHQWQLCKRFSISNNLFIGPTFFTQYLRVYETKKDVIDSYTNEGPISYSKTSKMGFHVGHYVKCNWHVGKRVTLFADFLYTFNKSKKLTLKDQLVFKQVMTPGIGMSFKIFIPHRSKSVLDWWNF